MPGPTAPTHAAAATSGCPASMPEMTSASTTDVRTISLTTRSDNEAQMSDVARACAVALRYVSTVTAYRSGFASPRKTCTQRGVRGEPPRGGGEHVDHEERLPVRKVRDRRVAERVRVSGHFALAHRERNVIRWDRLRHVAEIGRRGDEPAGRRLDALLRELVREELGHHRMRRGRRVEAHLVLERDLRPGLERRATGDLLERRDHLVEHLHVLAAQTEERLR